MKPYLDYTVLVRAWRDYRASSAPSTERTLTVRVHTNADGRVARKTAMEHALSWIRDEDPPNRAVNYFSHIQNFTPGATDA